MELSNVKLIARARTQSRAPSRETAALENISIEEPLTGCVRLRDFNARGMDSKELKLNHVSFVNENEGYIAVKTGRNQYRIQGHWIYGNEVIQGSQRLSDRAVYSVTIERPELSEVARSELRIVKADGSYAAA